MAIAIVTMQTVFKKKYTMKNILLIVFIIVVCCSKTHAQVSPGEQIAIKVAQKMKDTLGLGDEQKQRIYDINMQLLQKSIAVWKQHTVQDSIRYHLQRIEMTRDSLYKPILTADQLQLYRQKKPYLIGSR
jgi:hypothetical protein